MIAPPAIPVRRPPHAPFRAGAPRFTPALAPIERGAWLTPDSETHVLDWKQAMLDSAAPTHRAAPGSQAASNEAAGAVAEALNTRAGDLEAASRQVSDDLVVMTRESGAWRCAALTLTAPTFFAIDDVIGRPVGALHAPVPDAERLSARIERVFDGLRPGLVLERFNWTLQPGPERFTPNAAPLREHARTARAAEALEVLHVRVERQTLLKLPRTGAVLFAIRVCLDPAANLPVLDRAALAHAWRALGREGRAYKGWSDYDALAQAAFNAWDV